MKDKADLVVGCNVVAFGLLALCLICFFMCAGFFGGAIPEYSTGERVGTIFKISNKGLFWRSWEGELLLNDFPMRRPGSDGDANIFQFSTLDSDIAKTITDSDGKRVRIHYHQFWIRPWQQSTSYTVTKVDVLGDR